MDITLLQANTVSECWSIISSIATLLACIVAGWYTYVTSQIHRETKKATASAAAAAQSAAEAVKENATANLLNAKANQLTAYLTLRNDLLSDIIIETAKKKGETDFIIQSKIADNKDFVIEDDVMKISESALVTKVLNNIEDLGLLYQEEILSIEFIDGGFGYTILKIGSNPVVRKYVNDCTSEGEEVYDGFAELYIEIYKRLNDKEKEKYVPSLFIKDENLIEKPEEGTSPGCP